MSALALAGYFLRLGTTGFGGPIALVGYMQRDLVDDRGWFTADEFSRGLALAQLSPGPLAAQLALYLGWLKGGARGAALVGAAFVAPSFVMVLVLSALYVRFGALDWLRPAFAAVAAAVIGILARSAIKLSRMTLARDRTLWVIGAANVAAVVLLKQESLLVLVASGIVALGLANRQLTERLATVVISQLAPFPSLFASSPFAAVPSLFAFFSIAGLTVFGSGLAIVPYLYDGVVEQHHWLTSPQFLDAIAVSMITPGPVVITVAFIGYLVAGIPGAVVSAVGVFLPAYVVVIAVAPHFERVRRNPNARRFVEGVTAGATGAIGGAALLLATRVLTDVRSITIAVVAVLAIATRLRVPEPIVVLAAAALGIALA